MLKKEDIKAVIERRLETIGYNYPVEIVPSPDDDNTLCICVFNVPDHRIEAIENLIFDLEEEELGDDEYFLLPMVKDVETTEDYYSDKSPTMTLKDISEEVESGRSVKRCVETLRYYDRIVGETMHSIAKGDKVDWSRLRKLTSFGLPENSKAESVGRADAKVERETPDGSSAGSMRLREALADCDKALDVFKRFLQDRRTT